MKFLHAIILSASLSFLTLPAMATSGSSGGGAERGEGGNGAEMSKGFRYKQCFDRWIAYGYDAVQTHCQTHPSGTPAIIHGQPDSPSSVDVPSEMRDH